MDKILLILFIGSIALLWLSSVGYVLLLRLMAFFQRRSFPDAKCLPEIAIVIPTLNEEKSISQKIKDLEQSDYPKNRTNLVVVDGGSQDRTIELVQNEIARGKKIQLICLDQAQGKVDQVNYILKNLKEEIIVFTDADSRLEPSCVKELVNAIKKDPLTALVGATIRPKSKILEEQIHWWILNTIWWLEGEIFSSAGISGVCYAVNRKSLLCIDQEAIAEDIHLGLDISARGYRVQICRKAIAHELRVPQNVREFVQFRRRRGASYVNELIHFPDRSNPPFSWKLARLVRLWQFFGIAWVSLAAIVSGGILAATPYWPSVFILAVAFLLSALLLVYVLSNRKDKKNGIVDLCIATCRYSILTLISLFALNKLPYLLGPIGGKEESYDKSSAA